MISALEGYLDYFESQTIILRAKPVFGVVLFSSIFYLVFTFAALGLHDWNPLWFVWVGERYATLEPDGRIGYDGQFVYYIAEKGQAAIPHLDNPAYRLQRILFPITLRLLSLGSPTLIPWLAIAVNFCAIIYTTYIFAKWLKHHNLSPWYAMMYTLSIGTFMAYSRALTEPLAYCLAAIGAMQWLQKRHLQAVVWLALAALTKETTLIFVFGLICSALFCKNFGRALMATMAALPLLVWQVLLFASFATIPMTAGPALQRFPLSGIIPHLSSEPGRLSSFFFVGLPSLLLLPMALSHLLGQRGRSPTAWWLFLHCLLLLLMPIDVYDHIMHAGRNGAGLVMSVLFMAPVLAKPVRMMVLAYLVLPTLIWLVPVLRWAPWRSI